MYVTLTRVSTHDQPITNATLVAEEMVGWLQDIDGFQGLLMLYREGTAIGMTFWDSQDVADRHAVARAAFVERMASVLKVQIEERTDYEVAYAQLAQLRVTGRDQNR